jgi:tetratricopeptide (TPR) repeat protein
MTTWSRVTSERFLPACAGRFGLVLAVLAGLLIGSTSLPAQGGDPEREQVEEPEEEAPPPAKAPKEARAALSAAAKLRQVPKEADGTARSEALEKALAAYAEVERRFSNSPVAVAEAAFRRGEILYRLTRNREAVAAFEQSARTEPVTFGARALLEAGHVLRRQKLISEAIDSYRRGSKTGDGRYADRARLWLGKALVEAGRVPEARREWQEMGGDAKADARVRIQAFDELAMSYVRDKQVDQAQKILAEAEEALRTETTGEGKEAVALKQSLEKMRARKSLAKAAAAKPGGTNGGGDGR